MILPQADEVEQLTELQFEIAYSKIHLPVPSELMVPEELFWWHGRLIRQIEEENKRFKERTGKSNVLDKLTSKFGFLKGANRKPEQKE